MRVALRGELPGAARQPLTFFASPKKVSKERRPPAAAPAGFPKERATKREAKQTRLRLRQVSLLYPLCHPLFWQRQQRTFNGNGKAKAQATEKPPVPTSFRARIYPTISRNIVLRIAVDFKPLWTLPKRGRAKRIKK
jgi:hypothetical protein